MTDRPDIAIVGPGVVGTTLGVAAARAGYAVAGVVGRDRDRARAAAGRIGPDVPAGVLPDVPPAALVLLTVPDDAIAPLCRTLAEAGAFAAGAVVAHCSGAIGSDALAPARELCAAAVGSMHPLQTFPDVDAAVAKLAGTHFFVEGDDPAVAALRILAEAVGGRAVRIAPEAKLLYHASAVLASNGLVSLMDAALAAAEHAGIAPHVAREALRPLLEATLENALSLGPAAALTGPVARGDAELVERQSRRLGEVDADLARAYRVMGLRALALAERRGSVDPQSAARLRQALSGGD